MGNRAGRIAANVATFIFIVVMLLQLSLALGLLPISMAWGGTQEELTPALRIASLLTIVILAFFTYVVRRRVGLVGSGSVGMIIKILSWLITAFMLLNTVGNLTSQSNGERLLFTPLTVILLVCCFVVSISKPE